MLVPDQVGVDILCGKVMRLCKRIGAARRSSKITRLFFLLHRRGLIMIDGAALPFRGRGQEHFLDDLRYGHCTALDRSAKRVTAERPEANRTLRRYFARTQPKAGVVDHEEQAIALHRWPGRRKIQRYDRYAFEVYVLPDVEFRPVGKRKNTNTLTLELAGVIDIPKFGALIFRIPPMIGRTK